MVTHLNGEAQDLLDKIMKEHARRKLTFYTEDAILYEALTAYLQQTKTDAERLQKLEEQVTYLMGLGKGMCERLEDMESRFAVY